MDSYNQTYEGMVLSQSNLSPEYDVCTFTNSDFTGIDLRDVNFEECKFHNCNFTDVKIKNTAFKNVQFEECKMLGFQFSNCNPFLLEMNFNKCQLDYSSFYQLNLSKAKIENCSLKEADFVEAKLHKASFAGSNLYAATFDRTDLTQCDFRSAKNYSMDPNVNKLKGALFSKDEVLGLLVKYDIKIVV
jgi:fluoroquinolone resistance protein|tara:strand:- start:379 stop:942 length:564 start_codon:yes stop_codon:yes gene_type:complete